MVILWLAVMTIRDVDFQKLAYPVADELQIEKIDVAYGDLNGDGREEAAVVVRTYGGGTGHFTDGFVYTLRRGKPVLLATFAGGDRAEGGIRSARIMHRALVVEREHSSGCAICIDALVTTWYQWLGKTLRVAGETRTPVKGELN